MKSLFLGAMYAFAAIFATSCCSPMPLHDTVWSMTEYAGEPFEREDENSFKMSFSECGRLSGVAACNSFFSEYKADNGEVGYMSIINQGLTRAMCHNDAMENNFLRMLQAANKYEVKGSKLALMRDNAILATFTGTAAEKKSDACCQ